MTLLETATRNLSDVLALALEHDESHRAVVVFDSYSELSSLLTAGYRLALPKGTFVDFELTPPEAIMKTLAELVSGDLVVLVQSMSFRLNEFRLRVELFKQGLKVIEHPHLARMTGTDVPVYIDALAYDSSYYRGVGTELKRRIDHAERIVVESPGCKLEYVSSFEDTKLNIGDYTGMKNIGGQFPIGEVFTEPKDFDGVNGEVQIFAFGDPAFRVNVPAEPITLVVVGARVVATKNSTPEFSTVLEQIKADEEVWVRELGFGMNRAFSRERRVLDIGTYERMCGMHLSLGAKHSIYAKPGLKRRAGRYHVDVFVLTTRVLIDDQVVYVNDGYTF